MVKETKSRAGTAGGLAKAAQAQAFDAAVVKRHTGITMPSDDETGGSTIMGIVNKFK